LLGTTIAKFFPDEFGGNVMSEISCEPNMMCDRNQDCFKGFLSSWLTFATTIAPYTRDIILPKILASAQAAAKQCSGGDSKTACGRRWHQQDQWDGSKSLESDMSALSVFSSTMITHKDKDQTPLTAETGGTSKSNPNAGSKHDERPNEPKPVTTGDRAGAWIVTFFFACGWVASVSWMVYGG
jgi:mannan endo-1,6-alpha-mannosidase